MQQKRSSKRIEVCHFLHPLQICAAFDRLVLLMLRRSLIPHLPSMCFLVIASDILRTFHPVGILTSSLPCCQQSSPQPLPFWLGSQVEAEIMATRPVTPAALKPLPSSCALGIEFQPDCSGNARGGLSLSDTLVMSRTESVQCEAMSKKQAVMIIPQAETLVISGLFFL